MKPRAVVDVAVEVAKVRDPAETARGLAAIDGIDADAAALAKRIRAAPKRSFVPVITLRQADYDRVAASLDAVRGVSLNARTSPLPPTKTFARALLGTVGPVTAEQLEKTPSLGPGDEIGQSGLQAAYQERLGGAATRKVVVRDRETGAAGKTLLERPGRRARPLRTTLDLRVQAAAEEALAPVKGNAALVAVQPSTGDILAVANRPADSTYDRALTGLYAPGSTFKVVSTTALLRAGLDVDRTVDCPRTLTVDGKPFRNFEGDAAGAVPFRRDFAQSCNTAFVSLAGELKPNALTDAAADFGLGRKLSLGLPAADAKVPPPTSKVGQAAMMIGQDRIVASPLAMAGVAATVAAGRWNAPRLLRSDPRAARPRAARARHAAPADARRRHLRHRHGAARRARQRDRQERHRRVRRRRSAADARVVHRRARRSRRGRPGRGRALRRDRRRADRGALPQRALISSSASRSPSRRSCCAR